MSPASRGLSTQDIESIRATLAAGRRPKIVFTESAGQIAGQVGQVVAVHDPAAGEDFLVVRFGRDELPFSPTDLALPTRGAGPAKAARAIAPAKAAGREQAQPDPGVTGPPLLPHREERPDMPTSTPTATATEAPREPAPSGPAVRKGTRQARPKPPPGLTVTLAYADGEWTITAQQGAKTLAKPYLITPAEALKMVSLLDAPGVQEAVEAIVANERAQARLRAERLRAELAQIEAKLAELGVGS